MSSGQGRQTPEPPAGGARAESRPGKGLLVAALLLLVVEAALHQDSTLYRLRSVFAAGRALDKLLYVETHAPRMLILGNSRADNGFDPATVTSAMGAASPGPAFNLGLPGADAAVVAGILKRLDNAGVIGGSGVAAVVLSVDETLLQDVDTLGQEVFFADRKTLLEDGQYLDWLRSLVRLYGYSDNFRQLREPGTLQRFVQALFRDTDPVGGAASEHAGYRAGTGVLQDQAAAMRQEVGSSQPPSASNLRNLWRILDLLELREVEVAVVFPPLLNRNVLFIEHENTRAVPFLAVMAEIAHREIPVIVLDRDYPRNPAEFANPGHLNDRGAQRYSAMLGQSLSKIWSSPAQGQEARP